MASNIQQRSNGRKLALVLAALLAAGVGIAAGYGARQPSVGSLQEKVSERDREIAGLREEIGLREAGSRTLQTRLDALSQKAADLETQAALASEQAKKLEGSASRVQNLEVRLAALDKQLEQLPALQKNAEAIKPIVGALANDRLLLAEMRKDSPEDRATAERYWANVRNLALESSSALRPHADRIRNALPAYFTWRERSFGSQEESALTYVLTGASAYNESVDAFWNAVLLLVIDHIDAVSALTSK